MMSLVAITEQLDAGKRVRLDLLFPHLSELYHYYFSKFGHEPYLVQFEIPKLGVYATILDFHSMFYLFHEPSAKWHKELAHIEFLDCVVKHISA